MGFDWGEYVQLADYLRNVRPRPSDSFTEEATQRACVSRAYFGAFGLTKRRSTLKGFKPQNDVSDHAALLEFLRHQGFTEAARRLEKLRRERNHCDYDDEVPGLQARMKAALLDAQWLVTLARTYLP